MAFSGLFGKKKKQQVSVAEADGSDVWLSLSCRALSEAGEPSTQAEIVDCSGLLEAALRLMHHVVPANIELWASAPPGPLACVAGGGSGDQGRRKWLAATAPLEFEPIPPVVPPPASLRSRRQRVLDAAAGLHHERDGDEDADGDHDMLLFFARRSC